jgi:hypothetical protein
MLLNDAYDLYGLNDPRFLCGPYVCRPFPDVSPLDPRDIQRAVKELEPVMNTRPGAVPNPGYHVIDVFSEDHSVENSILTTAHEKVRKYHIALIEKFGVRRFLNTELQLVPWKYDIQSQLHWYPQRPQDNVILHHDTVGSTFFVILHYYNTETIYGPEFTFDTATNPYRPQYSGLSRSGPIDTNGAWPEALRERMLQARTALYQAYGPSPIIKNTLIPPSGAVGFVDELVHHTTPLMTSRNGLDDPRFSKVIIRDSGKSTPTFNLGQTRGRSTSFERKHHSLNQTAVTATQSRDRAFMRVWVTVQNKKDEAF